MASLWIPVFRKKRHAIINPSGDLLMNMNVMRHVTALLLKIVLVILKILTVLLS